MSDENQTDDATEDDMAAAMAAEAAERDATEADMAAAMATEAAGGNGNVELAELAAGTSAADDPAFGGGEDGPRTAQDLEPVFDVPVNVQAVLGKSNLEVSQLLKLGPGAVIELDRKVGEAIDIYVNDRLVARGEVVLVEDHLGVTMTEIIKSETN